MCIRFSIVGQDGKVPGLSDACPRSLLCSLQVSRREDLLMVRVPPVWPARRTENELVSIVEDDESVV